MSMPGSGAIMGRWVAIKIRDDVFPKIKEHWKDVKPKIKEFWNNVKQKISHYLNERKITKQKKIHSKDTV